jgi:PAS domain S-box-containing protein
MQTISRLRTALLPPYGIRTVIMVGATATVFAFSIVYALASYTRLSASTLLAAQSWSASVAQLVSSSNTTAIILNDIAAMESNLQQVANLPGIDRIAIYRDTGRELVNATKSDGVVTSEVASASHMTIPLTGVQSISGSLHENYYEVWAPIHTGRKYPSAWVKIHFSLSQRDADLRGFWSGYVLGIVALAGLLLGSLHLIISRALKPIRDLSKFAADMPGHLGIQTSVSDYYAEVNQLGSALNYASYAIAEHVGRTRAIVNTASEAIIGLNNVGIVTTINPAAISFFGQGEVTLVGSAIEIFIPGLTANALYEMFGNPMSSYFGMERILRKDFFGARADSTPFPVEISLGQVSGIEGLRYVCIVRDVSDERAALEFTELYERALACSHNAVFIANARQPTHPLVYVNEAFQTMLGLPLHQILGRNIEALVMTDPSDPAVRELRSSFLEQRCANVMLQLPNSDGTHRIVECSVSPLVSDLGVLTHFVGIILDVTARVRAEDANAKRRAQLNTIFSLSPDGFVLFDANNQMVFANPAFEKMIGGFSPSSDVAMGLDTFQFSLTALCAAEHPPLSFQFKTADGGEAQEWQARLHFVWPQTRVVQAQARRTTEGHGETIFYFRDVTHEDAVDRMKSEFLAAAAHELRTPMVSIFGFTELLLRRKFSPERQADMLETIHRQSGLLVKMINELLDLARIESRGGLDLKLEPYPLNELLVNSVKGLMLKDTDRQVVIRDIPQVMVLIDAEKMQLAMNNLLSNAFKYSPQGGDVSVCARLDALEGTSYAVIEVCDQGLGMSPDQLARAFERFYRADASGNIPGTGLGLSMVREVASLHNGHIELDSVLGAGTTARLWIPLDVALPSEVKLVASSPDEISGKISVLA